MIDELIHDSNSAFAGSMTSQLRQAPTVYEIKLASVTDKICMTTSALRMMQLLGEGHHTGFQNFLRHTLTLGLTGPYCGPNIVHPGLATAWQS